MNDLPQLVKLESPTIKSRLSSAQTGRKVAIGLLAALIVSVMIVWFSFLGWGFIAMTRWLLDCFWNLWGM
jgi:hypothetical protein